MLAALGCVAAATFLDAARLQRTHAVATEHAAMLVAQFGLTDLALFTEARYTRHRAVADLHSAFQDHPFGLEHFPSGSLLPPPVHLTQARHEPVDRQTALSR
ncbi:MAG: hypothetical protein H3C26_15450 [Rhodocyclaceae bacterium]|nr:hypothetical protein [Rhodocyclaceae bacterium]